MTGEFWKWNSTTKRIECFHISFYCFGISYTNIHLVGTFSFPKSFCDPYYLSILGSLLSISTCTCAVHTLSLFSVAMYIFLGMTTWDWIIYQEAWSQEKTDFSLPSSFSQDLTLWIFPYSQWHVNWSFYKSLACINMLLRINENISSLRHSDSLAHTIFPPLLPWSSLCLKHRIAL